MPEIDLEAFWQGVSGGLEDNEAPLHAALRELSEETGIVPDRIVPTGFAFSYRVLEKWKPFYPAGATDIIERCFLAECASNFKPVLSKEHDMYRWCAFDEAIRLLHFPDNKRALRSCEDIALQRTE